MQQLAAKLGRDRRDRAQPGASGASIRCRWPMRSAASAWPAPSAQSRMSATGTAGKLGPRRRTSARHQPQPAYSAAPGADSSVTGRPSASASRASARLCTTTAGYCSLTTDR